MKQMILAIVLFTLTESATIQITTFDNYSVSPWNPEYTNNPKNFSFVSSGFGTSLCARFALDSGDYWFSPYHKVYSARSELSLKNTAPAEVMMIYSWDFKVDTSYEETDGFQIVGQFHDIPDFLKGETWGNYPGGIPPISYQYKHGKLWIVVYNYSAQAVWHIASADISKGIWHTIVSTIYWSVTDSGYFEATVNGVPIASDGGITRYTARNLLNSEGCYLKIGLYRDIDIETKGVVYFDNIYIIRN